MKFMRPLDIFIVLCFTLLFIYNYFPNIPLAMEMPKSAITLLIIGLFLFSLFFKHYRNVNNMDVFKWQVFMTAYILFLMGLFTSLGGESSTGIAFSNKFFWIVLLISSFEMFSQWKKVKQSQSVSS